MNEPLAVTIPLINPNEPEALLVDVSIQEGQNVQPGEILCILETTKSTFELTAERQGFVVGIQYHKGETISAGSIFCFLVDALAQKLPIHDRVPSDALTLPSDLRITQPARELAESSGVDFNELPRDRLITRDFILQFLQRMKMPDTNYPISTTTFMPNSVVLFGGGGHAKMLIELVQAEGKYLIEGILDDGKLPGTTVLGIPVLGGKDLLPRLYQSGLHHAINAVGGIGQIQTRINVTILLEAAGFTLPPVIHPSSLVEPSVQLANGCQVFAKAYVGAETQFGIGAIASTGCIISHDCILEEYAIVSPGAILAGEVTIGAGALIGMGATINLRVKVGAGAKIGNSATIKENVPAGWVVQAGASWPK